MRRWIESAMCSAVIPNVATAVLIGSHTDTVPKGGWLDGALGVIYGLEIARSAIEAGERLTHRHRRGVVRRRGGDIPAVSRQPIVLRRCEPRRRSSSADRAMGVPLRAGAPIRRAGRAAAAPRSARQLCFLEAHIEQGPRLEAMGRRIGIVTAIVGIRRFRIRARGRADHAGTTPMAARSDAGAELIKIAAWVNEEFARLAGPDTVWNIGAHDIPSRRRECRAGRGGHAARISRCPR